MNFHKYITSICVNFAFAASYSSEINRVNIFTNSKSILPPIYGLKYGTISLVICSIFWRYLGMPDELHCTKKKYKVIGTRPIRHDGVDKVTGKALYGADIQLPSMLHGKVLRSPHAHARIISIDISEAVKVPEVQAIITNQNFPAHEDEAVSETPGPAINLKQQTANILAGDKALYKGHAIAAVAASSLHAAEEALALINV